MSNFQAALRRFAQKILPEAAARANKKLGEKLLERTKELTPVKTGALRDAWKMSVEGQVVRITNDLPYAGEVEYGTASREPAGMMTTALAEAEVGLL